MEMRVVLDRVGPYSPGDTVQGRVILVKSSVTLLPKPLGLHIQFDGKAYVKFTVADRWGYKGRWRTHSATETYFHSANYLVGDGQHEVAELSGGGVAEFPFSFSMPALLPSSYKGTHGSVDYTVTVTLKRAWGVHKEVVQPFQVCSQLDVASVHHLQRRGEAGTIRKSERVGMWWWGGTVFVHLNLRKRAYIPGEFVQFSAQIINDSKSSLHKAKLLLTQEVRFLAQGASHLVTHILKKVKGPGVKGGERTVNWDDPTSLKIPPLPPTTTLGVGSVCSLIEVNYFVHLLVQPSSLTFKDRTIACKLPITLGTKRGVGARESWCYGDTNNRVGSIFSTLERSTMAPTPSTQGEWNYYQNVVFPLNRCFSAPLYENHRFGGGGHVSPFSLPEDLEDSSAAGPPPSYEEAMCDYQNSVMTPTQPRGLSLQKSNCTSPVTTEPLYNN
ncbi:arrestin domain-containing protein 2 [Folsomia candida]|uniref:arrestin domain-containing protein 2 n=1 Tax=Folsomia candida TaxID=158441 RepID=UPI000B8FC93F|nr:arrestin domain-containing protein 2 [Folsomia candida]